MMTLRPWSTPGDFRRIAEIYTGAFWDPTTADALASADRAFPSAGERRRLVCTNDDGLIVAFGTLLRDGHEEPGHYSIRVVVDQPYRRQGIGSMVLRELERQAGELHATRLDCKFRDDPSFLAFAQHHGYSVHERQLGWTLAVQAFDEAPFTDVLAWLTKAGLRFVTLADHDPRLTPEALYELERHANHDEPGYENEPFLTYDQWYQETYENAERPLDCTIVAMDGAEPVAMSAIAATPDGNMHVTFTGVHRDYRGRGLAQAVKLLAIRAAKRHGAAQLGTGNSERNQALLHVNAKFGFQRTPGMYWCMKHLSSDNG